MTFYSEYMSKLRKKLKKIYSQKDYKDKNKNIRYWTDEKGNIHRERIKK